MKKCYIVTEYGGEWEDKWESILGVYMSKESAEKAKLENEKSHSYTSPYSNEYFDTLMEEVDNYEFEHDFNFDSYRDGVLQIHPELARQPGFLENLDVWEHNYYEFHDYFGTSISEHDLYE